MEYFFENFLDDVLASIAIIIASWSAYYTHKHSGQSVKLQQEALNLEKQKKREAENIDKKADLEPELISSGSTAKPTKNLFRISNRGKSDAKNVQIFINGREIYKCDDILNRDRYKENNFKIPSGQSTQFKVAKSKDSEPIWDLKLIYEDRASKYNVYEDELEF
jgi:hypothetical protein